MEQQREKWYLNTWIIALLFSVWFFGFPLIIGVVLISLQRRQNAYAKFLYEDKIRSLKKELEQERSKNEEYGIYSFEDAREKMDNIEYTVENLSEIESEIKAKSKELQRKKDEIVELDKLITMQEFGVYSPVYEFANSEKYKDKLTLIRKHQKEMITSEIAVSAPTNFSFDGSVSKGRLVIKDNVKQILRSFNNECDVLINNVKFNTVENTRKKIEKSYEQLNRMNARMNIRLQPAYLSLKLDELNLAYEYSLKKQEEKEAAKEERARLREEAKLQKEIEEARKEARKEQSHYQNALNVVLEQVKLHPEDNNLLQKKTELENQLVEIDRNLKDIDYREANKRAGYVYVISNIGSFGEGVYKIGMTRRLEPLDRIDELGGASVPFNFDVHAMLFSDDAPSLETALHHAFENKKVNMVNARREFFRVDIDEIERVVKANYDKTVDFNKNPEAEQYRKTLMLQKAVH